MSELKSCIDFHLKKVWFDKIKSGEKTHEYRLQTKEWTKRLSRIFIGSSVRRAFIIAAESGGTYDTKGKPCFYSGLIRFACGYPKSSEKEKWLWAKIKRILTNIDGRETDLDIDEPVFDIEFELIKTEEQYGKKDK